MGFFKYYNEQKDADGEKLSWPGGPEGFPFRGDQPPQTTEKEYEDLKLSGKFRCRTFYLSKPEDMKDYVAIRDKCSNGLWFLVDRDRQWDNDTKEYRIFLEWVEPAYDTVGNRAAVAVATGGRLGETDAIKQYTQEVSGFTLPYEKLAGVGRTGW